VDVLIRLSLSLPKNDFASSNATEDTQIDSSAPQSIDLFDPTETKQDELKERDDTSQPLNIG